MAADTAEKTIKISALGVRAVKGEISACDQHTLHRGASRWAWGSSAWEANGERPLEDIM